MILLLIYETDEKEKHPSILKTRAKPIKTLVSNNEVGREAPKREVSLRLVIIISGPNESSQEESISVSGRYLVRMKTHKKHK